MAAYYTYNFLPPVSSDLDSLLHDFEQESEHDYQSFANVWRNHKLELLFKSADIQPNSFRFFLDDSMTVAAAYLGEPWRVPIQLGALYCLFTIYIYQIEEPKIKIRLTLNTWNSLLDLMESSSDIPSDAKIILSKLINEHAFVISATRHEMGPRFFTKMNYMKSGKYMREDALLSSRLNIDEKLVKICEETDQLYTKAKDSLIEAYGGIANLPNDFMSIKPNFIEQLKKGLGLNEIGADNEEEQQQQQQQSDPEQRAPVQTQISIGTSRSRIRAKAEQIEQSTTSQTVKNEYEDDEDDDDDDECEQFVDMNDDNEEEEDEDEEIHKDKKSKVSKKKKKTTTKTQTQTRKSRSKKKIN